MRYEVVPATPDLWPKLERLFGRAGASNGCWCMYWLLGPEYHRRDRTLNRDELRASTEGESPGLLAFATDPADAEGAVGWVRLTPRSELAWLNRTRYLEAIDDSPVWSVPCFFIARTHRGQGVSDALLVAAVETAQQRGAPAVEGYPVDPAVPGATKNAFTGYLPVFLRNGFTEVARRRESRPIVRRALAVKQGDPSTEPAGAQ
jgi:GNAT superfamily N-acetyltransferase